MFIFICKNKNYVTYDCDLTNKGLKYPGILILHTQHFKLPKFTNNDELIIYIVENMLYNIVDYTLEYLLLNYDKFERIIRILFAYNQYKFIMELTNSTFWKYRYGTDDEKMLYKKIEHEIDDLFFDELNIISPNGEIEYETNYFISEYYTIYRILCHSGNDPICLGNLCEKMKNKIQYNINKDVKIYYFKYFTENGENIELIEVSNDFNENIFNVSKFSEFNLINKGDKFEISYL